MKRAPALLMALVATPFLAGCVAAAIPVLAAGGIVKTQADERNKGADMRPRVALPADPAAPEAPDQTPAATIVRDYTLSDGTKVTVTNSTGPAAIAEPAIAALPPVAAAEDTTAKVTYLAGVTALPPPTGAQSPGGAADAASGYSEFIAFARAQAAVPAAGEERISAMLVDSSKLIAETSACSIHPAAVLIDIDPAGDVLDTARPLAGDPAFAADLAELRSEGVEIGWVSARTADRAGAIRKTLSAAGLDPEGRDQLVLLRFPEERKQTRREDFAKANCVLAIAGDERADFDELFSYLRDPNAASPLDILIGHRWFLVPPPLN